MSCTDMSSCSAVQNGGDRAGDMRREIKEKLAETFDRLCVPEELMDKWSAKQERSLRRASQGHLHMTKRMSVLNFLLRASPPRYQQHVPGRASSTCLFEAVQLFDFSSDTVASARPETVLSRAVASWTICEKLTGFQTSSTRNVTSHFATAASEFSRLLGGSAVSQEDILKDEVWLMKNFFDVLTMPTLMSWTSTFLTRLDVCTNWMLSGALQQVRLACRDLGMRVTCSVPTSALHNPRDLALGVCSLVLMAVDIVPPDALRPDVDDWDMFLSSVATHCVVQNPGLVPHRAALAGLEFATLQGTSYLQYCSGLVADALRRGVV